MIRPSLFKPWIRLWAAKQPEIPQNGNTNYGVKTGMPNARMPIELGPGKRQTE